ncbi:MAG TPA: hypothetical protein VN456_00995 [Desulfosporosinus sp.]|nr:hypothetical protein [Desulfosporosinus sp.]
MEVGGILVPSALKPIQLGQFHLGERLLVEVVQKTSEGEGTIRVKGQDMSALLESSAEVGETFWVKVGNLSKGSLLLIREPLMEQKGDMQNVVPQQFKQLTERGLPINQEIITLLKAFPTANTGVLGSLLAATQGTPMQEGAPTQGAPLQGTPTQGTSTQGAPTQGTPTQGTPMQGTPLQGTATQGTPTQGTPMQEGAQTQGTPTQGTPTQGTPMQGTATQGTPTQGTPTQGTPTQGTPTQGTPTQGTPTQGTPTQGTPTQGTPTQGTPTQGTPMQGTATQGTSTQGTSTQGTPTQGIPTQGIPTQVTVTQGTPLQGTPLDALKMDFRQFIPELNKLSEENGAEKLVECLRKLGLNYEHRIQQMLKLDGPAKEIEKNNLRETFKFALLEAIQSQEGQDLDDSDGPLAHLLRKITGQQLWLKTGAQDSAFMLLQLPLLNQGQPVPVQIAIESARKGSKMDEQHCRIALQIETSLLGDIGIDAFFDQDSVTFRVLSHNLPFLPQLLEEVMPETRAEFSKLGFNIEKVETGDLDQFIEFQNFLRGIRRSGVDIQR